jgi:hypothetical protein
MRPITPIILPDFAPSLRYEWKSKESEMVQHGLNSTFPGRSPASSSWPRFTLLRSTKDSPCSTRTNEPGNCEETSAPTF